MTDITMEQARVAKEHMKELLADSPATEYVVGVGISRQDIKGVKILCVKINVSEPIVTTGFPTEVDGVPVVWQVTGKIQKSSPKP